LENTVTEVSNNGLLPDFLFSY